MNFDEIKTQLLEWMINFVEHPNPSLGNWAPCPYARAARINNRIHITHCDVDQLSNTVDQSLSLLSTYEVIVICFDHNLISSKDCSKLTTDLNTKLMQQDVVILEDHPNLVEHVAGVKMNFGLCGLFVVQKLSKLNEAANKLKASGYYDHWAKSELDEVVTWRND